MTASEQENQYNISESQRQHVINVIVSACHPNMPFAAINECLVMLQSLPVLEEKEPKKG